MQEEEQTEAALDQTKGYTVQYPDSPRSPLRSPGGDAGHLRLNVGRASYWGFLLTLIRQQVALDFWSILPI